MMYGKQINNFQDISKYLF